QVCVVIRPPGPLDFFLSSAVSTGPVPIGQVSREPGFERKLEAGLFCLRKRIARPSQSSMPHRSVNYVRFYDVQAQILDADLLLWRRRGLIASAGRGAYSHAGKAAWWGDDLFCLEVREWRGGRAVTLESQVM